MPEVSLAVDVPAPVEQVWAAAVDWDRQDAWMLGTTVRGGHGPGARLVARTALGPFGFDDPMVVTTWEPPYRCVVRHEGRVVRGSAAFEVVPRADGTATFVWSEWLVLPFGTLGELGFALLRPLIVWPLRVSLRRFAAFASNRGTSAAPWPGTTAPR